MTNRERTMLCLLFISLMLQLPAVDEAGDPLPAGAIKRLGTTRWRAVGPANGELTFSNDGKTLYSTSGYDCKLHAWDTASGKERFRCETPDEQRLIRSAHSRDGRWIVSHGYRQTANDEERITVQGTHLFDAQTGQHLQFWPEQSQSCLAISSDGSVVARCLFHQKIGEHLHVRNIKSGEDLFQWHEGEGNSILSISFSPDDRQIYLIKYAHEVGKALTLYIIDAKTGTTVTQRLLERTKNIAYHAISSRDRTLAYYDNTEGKIRIEDLLTGKLRKAIPFSPSKKNQIIVGGKASADEGPSLGFTFSPDGSRLAVSEGVHSSGSSNFLQLLVYDVTTWQQIQAWNLQVRWLGHSVISPDNRILAVGGSSNVITLYDIATGRQLNEAVNQNPPGDIRCIKFSPDGKWLALAGHDTFIDLWNTSSWKREKRWKDPLVLTNSVAFSPDSSKLLTGGFASQAQMWEIPSGKLLRRIKAPLGMINSVTWLDQGKSIAIGGNGPLMVFDANTGETLSKHELRGANSSVFSSNGLLWFCFDQLIQTKNGELLATIPKLDKVSVYHVAYSHQSLLTVNAEKVTTMYERATMQIRWQMKLPGFVSAFSNDGQWVARGGGWDYTAKPLTISVCHALTGKERCQFIGQEGLQCLAFSPDGRCLVSAGSDGTALVWQLPQAPATAPWSLVEAEKSWGNLASNDAALAGQAIARFIEAPEQTIAFLKDKQHACTPADTEHVKSLITQLEHVKFSERENAFAQLKELGMLAEPTLKQSLLGKLSLEARRRVELLLEAIRTIQLTSQERRALRSAEIAERINTPASRELLLSWSKGAPGARLTKLAKEIVEP